MKSYTDIEQSKKLAEILPLESADMAWCNNSIKGINYTDMYSANLYTVKEMKDAFDEALVGWDKHWELIPCWSLSALLDLLPNNEHIETTISRGSWEIDTVEYLSNTWWCEYEDTENQTEFNMSADNPVDACYEMILKLNELKLL